MQAVLFSEISEILLTPSTDISETSLTFSTDISETSLTFSTDISEISLLSSTDILEISLLSSTDFSETSVKELSKTDVSMIFSGGFSAKKNAPPNASTIATAIIIFFFKKNFPLYFKRLSEMNSLFYLYFNPLFSSLQVQI